MVMSSNIAKGRLSKAGTSDISVELQHKQSKLDLLDNTTLTSFPIPNIDVENTRFNTTKSSISSNPTTPINKKHNVTSIICSPATSDFINISKRGKPNTLSEYKNTIMTNLHSLKSAERKSPVLRSMTASSVQTTDSMNTNDRIRSLANSLISRTAMGSSKKTTPPSSLDYESSMYDYRLVLQQSENYNSLVKKVSKGDVNTNMGETFKTATGSNAIDHSSYTDMYIQSLYQDIILKDESKPQIQCVICESPVFENDKYFNRILNFKGIICENCFHNKNNSSMSIMIDNVKDITISEDNYYGSDDVDVLKKKGANKELLAHDCTPIDVDIDIYSSLDDTCHTVQLQIDSTMQSDEDDTTEYGIYQNMDFFQPYEDNDDGDNHRNNRFGRNRDDNFERIIRRLKKIERSDLRIRQSIADLRGTVPQRYAITIHTNDDYTSVWNAIKRRFVK